MKLSPHGVVSIRWGRPRQKESVYDISPPAVQTGRGVYFCPDGCHQIAQARQAAAPLLESQSPLNKAAASSLLSLSLLLPHFDWLHPSPAGGLWLDGSSPPAGGCRLPLHETASSRGGTRAAWSGRSPASRTSCSDGTRTTAPVGVQNFVQEAVCLLCVSSLTVRFGRFLATGRMLLLKWNWVNGSPSPSSVDALFDPRFHVSLPSSVAKQAGSRNIVAGTFKLAVFGCFFHSSVFRMWTASRLSFTDLICRFKCAPSSK